jgi:hypothetical protein
VAAEIRRAVADGHAGPGHRLPLAKDPAVVLGVNKSTPTRSKSFRGRTIGAPGSVHASRSSAEPHWLRSAVVDLRAVIADNLGSNCSHESVCDAVHQVLEPGTLTSDHYCCRSTGSLCEAVYDGYYDGIISGDRVDTIYRAVTRWSSRPQPMRH